MGNLTLFAGRKSNLKVILLGIYLLVYNVFVQVLMNFSAALSVICLSCVSVILFFSKDMTSK